MSHADDSRGERLIASPLSDHGDDPPSSLVESTGSSQQHVVVEIVQRPKRPLSAYNLFFQDERQKLLAELPVRPEGVPLRRGHGKIGFSAMAKTIAARWKAIDGAGKEKYQALAQHEKARYKTNLSNWKRLLRKNPEKKAIHSSATKKQEERLSLPVVVPSSSLAPIRLREENGGIINSHRRASLPLMPLPAPENDNKKTIVEDVSTSLGLDPETTSFVYRLATNNEAHSDTGGLMGFSTTPPSGGNVVRPFAQVNRPSPISMESDQTITTFDSVSSDSMTRMFPPANACTQSCSSPLYPVHQDIATTTGVAPMTLQGIARSLPVPFSQGLQQYQERTNRDNLVSVNHSHSSSFSRCSGHGELGKGGDFQPLSAFPSQAGLVTNDDMIQNDEGAGLFLPYTPAFISPTTREHLMVEENKNGVIGQCSTSCSDDHHDRRTAKMFSFQKGQDNRHALMTKMGSETWNNFVNLFCPDKY